MSQYFTQSFDSELLVFSVAVSNFHKFAILITTFIREISEKKQILGFKYLSGHRVQVVCTLNHLTKFLCSTCGEVSVLGSEREYSILRLICKEDRKQRQDNH